MTGLTLLPTDSERPTLKTIAAETGLAIATVSRALKDAPDIGEETKKRVRKRLPNGLATAPTAPAFACAPARPMLSP